MARFLIVLAPIAVAVALLTGFGLLGHLYEMLAASEVAAEVLVDPLPLLPGAREHAAAGVNTGGGRTNAEYLAPHVEFETGVEDPLRDVLFDPQTSGGLLMAVPPERTRVLLEELATQGVNVRAVIGKATTGKPGSISVRGG